MGVSRSGLHKQMLELAHEKWISTELFHTNQASCAFVISHKFQEKKKVTLKCFPHISKSIFCIKYKKIFVTDVQTKHL